MTIRSGLHVAGSLPAGRGGGIIGHASIRWLLFHIAKPIPHFSEACFNGGPGRRLNWVGVNFSFRPLPRVQNRSASESAYRLPAV
jgi:hypothetical protein